AQDDRICWNGSWTRYMKEDSNGRDLHPVVAGTQTLRAFAGTDRGVTGPTMSLPAGAGLRTWSGLQAGRTRQLSAVHGAGRGRHDGAVQFRLLRHRHVVGS